MSWQPELDEIERRRRIAAGHGGPDKVAKHRAQGRLPVRERIDAAVKDPQVDTAMAAAAELTELEREAKTMLGLVKALFGRR
jgi:acetyl-CoA carboxylase carboxyltransferase component